MGRFGTTVRNSLLVGAFRLLLEVGSRLPLGLMQRVGAGLGVVALGLLRSSRRRARTHLRHAFPELSERQTDRLVQRCAHHLGTTLGEITWLWRADHDEVAARCDIVGVEHLRVALDQGHGAVLVTAHAGNWELLNARLGVAGMPMVIAVRDIFDARVDDAVTALRQRFGAEVVKRSSGARRLLGALSHDKVVGLLIDQDIGDLPGAFVPFFGRPAWTPTGAATLALRSGAPVVPAFIHRRADGHHQVEIQPPLASPAGTDKEERTIAVTAAATAAIEAQIRCHPEQWVWMHRRWKTRPIGS